MGIRLQLQASLFPRVLLQSLSRGAVASDLFAALPAQSLPSTEVPGSCSYSRFFALLHLLQFKPLSISLGG